MVEVEPTTETGSTKEEEKDEPCPCVHCIRDRAPFYTILGKGWTIFGFRGPLGREEARVEVLYDLGPGKVPEALLTDELKLNILSTATFRMAQDIKRQQK